MTFVAGGWMRSAGWRQGTTGVALVALLFSLFMASGLLLVWRRAQETRLLEHPELTALRVELDATPESEALTARIRALERELRREYLRRDRQLEVGGWLLLAGMLVFAVAAPLAVQARRRIPTTIIGPREDDARRARLGRLAVAAVALLLAGSAVALPHWLAPPERAETAAGVWTRFRGPGGRGVSPYERAPLVWDARDGQARNLRWKSVVPLPGLSSPVIWEDRIYLTGATETTREVYCFDALTGQLLWRRPVAAGPESTAVPPNVNRDTGYAAPTPVTDGRRVWAMFANGDVVCFDRFGEQRWCVHLGTPVNMYGHASSPLLDSGRLFVQLDQDADRQGSRSALIALDADTGAQLWRVPRDVESSWPSPILIDAPSGPQLLTVANPFVIAYEPATGKEVWRVDGVEGDGGPSPSSGDGLVLAVNASSPLMAIRTDGHGDVTGSHIAWTWDEGLPDVCSPLAAEGLVWLLSTDGQLTCLDLKTGEKQWLEELDGTFYTSPSLAAGRVYLIARDGLVIVLAAERSHRELARGHLGEGCDASPAFAEGRIYVRGKRHLFCFEAAEERP